MYDPNNKILNTHSNKISKVTPVWKFIIDKIDSCQEIKRLCRYITTTPLSEKGTFNGKIINQYDLKETLTKSVTEYGQNYKKVIYDSLFDPNTQEEGNIVKLFISPFNCRNREDGKGTMYFKIDILCDEKINSLATYGEKRIYKIAEYICDLFDGYTLDKKDEVSKYVGNLEINMLDDFRYVRDTKTTTNMVLTLPIIIDYVDFMRSR